MPRVIQDFHNKSKGSLVGVCRLLGISRQVYYRSLKSEKQKKEKTEAVVALVHSIRAKMPQIGTRKLYYLLYDQLRALGVGRDCLFAILKANHLLIRQKRQYHVTTDSHHRFRKHKNLVEFLSICRPEQVWVSDITYIGNQQRPMYLSVVTDVYSKKIMGYDVSDSLSATGAMRAMKMAIENRSYKKQKLIHHSDRGVQYCCASYQRILKKKGIRCSMTESYDPYQNAVAERVNGILKQEFIQGISLSDITLMRQFVQESIQIYNKNRPHLSNKMLTPQQMHNQRKIKMKTYKKKPPVLED